MIYVGIFFICIIVLCILFKVRIHIKSFFKRGYLAKRGPYGTRVYSGVQGSGKTTSLATFIYDNRNKIFLFSNVDFRDPIQYIKFNGFEGLIEMKNRIDSDYYDIGNKQIVIVFDELFTELTRGSKLSTEVLDFLCQLRKRKILFLTTCQSWNDLPIQFRRLCRYNIKCKLIPLGITSIHFNEVQDAENMKWDEIAQDFVAPTCWTDLYKTRKVVGNLFDTNQRITTS